MIKWGIIGQTELGWETEGGCVPDPKLGWSLEGDLGRSRISGYCGMIAVVATPLCAAFYHYQRALLGHRSNDQGNPYSLSIGQLCRDSDIIEPSLIF